MEFKLRLARNSALAHSPPTKMERQVMTQCLNHTLVVCKCRVERNKKIETVIEALESVLSEDGVKKYLSSYVMGVELIDRLEKLKLQPQ